MIKNKHSVVIIEQSELLIKGVEQTLNSSSVFTVANIESKLPTHVNSDIDIVIVNPNLILQNSQIKIRSIYPSAKIIALLYHYVERSIIEQFDDIIGINDSSAKIIQILESSIKREKKGGNKSTMEELSDRERVILVAVAKGMMNKEIAHLHNISVHTVVSHRKNIARKTRIRTVPGLLIYALLNKLIDEAEVLK